MTTNNDTTLISILQDALSGDKSLRDKAEADITRLADENFGLFLLNLSIQISNEEVHKTLRQISATIIKNMITKTQYTNQWNKLEREQKEKIKFHLLSTLASKEVEIRKAAGMSIAGICKVELPQKQWLDIFNILIGTSLNENLYIQLSSVTTLTFIFQDISVSDIPDNTVASILDCFYNILNKDTCVEELQLETLNSLMSLLPFIQKFFLDNNQKILLLNLIKKFTTHQSSRIRNKAIQIFVDIVRFYYDYINEYSDTLIEFTSLLMEKDETQNALLCYEIWCSIALTESTRLANNLKCYNICEKAYKSLIKILFTHLVTNVYNNDEWTLDKSSTTLITQFSICCGTDYLKMVIEYIGNNIQSENQDLKHSALGAFSCILETVHRNNLIDIVKKSLDLVISTIDNPQSPEHIKDISASVIERICEFFGDEFIKDIPLFQKLYTFIVSSLTKHTRKVVVRLCNSIHNLVKFIYWEENQNTNILSAYMKGSLTQLINLAFAKGSYNTENNVALSSFFAIGSIVERAAKDTQIVLLDAFNNLINAFESTLVASTFQDENIRSSYQSYIASSLTSFIITTECDEKILTKLYNQMIISFQQKQSVYDEGILLIGSIALHLGEKFNNLMPSFTPYLIAALKSTKDTSLCKSAIHCTSDIVQGLKTYFGQYINELLPLIMFVLSDNEIDKILKPHAFNVLSDLFYCSTNEVAPFFNNIMQLIGTALEAAMMTPNSDDVETVEYFKGLREHIIETITCIFYAITDLQRQRDFIPYVGAIMKFLNKINTTQYTPSFEIAKLSLGLIGDLCNAYQTEMKSIIDTNIIKDMIDTVKKVPKTEDPSKIQALIDWSEKCLTSVINSK